MRWLKDGVHEQAKPITGETDQRDSWVFLEPKPPVLCTAGESERGDGRSHSQATPARFPGSGRPKPIALSGHHTLPSLSLWSSSQSPVTLTCQFPNLRRHQSLPQMPTTCPLYASQIRGGRERRKEETIRRFLGSFRISPGQSQGIGTYGKGGQKTCLMGELCQRLYRGRTGGS